MRMLAAWVLAFACVQLTHASDCQTSRREPGICQPVMECDYIRQLTAKHGNKLPPSEVQYITGSVCGTANGYISICCVVETPQSDEDTEAKKEQRGMDILKDTACGDSANDRVAFGTEVDIGEFPWMTLLRYDTQTDPFKCGGSLITNRYVLTAAHCVSKSEKPISVRLGEHNIDEERDCQWRGERQVCAPPPEDYEIEKIIMHEDYKGIQNDIALLRLKKEVKFTDYIRPVCLPITPKSRTFAKNQDFYLAGWGGTETGTSFNVLLKAVINHVDLAVCKTTYRVYNINENHLCVGGLNKKSSCRGDSGGPLFFWNQYKSWPRFVQYGIVSQGLKTCGSRELAAVYTNVITYLPWIARNLV